MINLFFDHPILNSPYEYPARHWELDDQGQPTQRIIESRRRAEFITPIPKPRKRKASAAQQQIVFDEGQRLSTPEQQYDHTAIINAVRQQVDQWRNLPNPSHWHVTPETARLLQHWRHHQFSNIRPFFCQVEAVETVIWLTEVAPHVGNAAKSFLEHLANANRDANPELMRLALKLATGAGKTTVMAMLIAKEAEKNNEVARVWISGLEVVARKLGVSRVVDLSATPFFLRGSGYAEGTLFPWTMSDFSLMDAIELGSGVSMSRYTFKPAMNSHWKTTIIGLDRMAKADHLVFTKTGIHHKLYWDNWPAKRRENLWLDTQSGGFNEAKTYVVQTTSKIIERCILMATDPGDLVLDPTCGSGTTAYVAEQWGRRWITIDTSRVALALARARIMGARYPYYLLADSPEGQIKEAEVTRSAPSTQPTRGDIRQGFVYECVPHITLKSIANNAEIDVIWEHWQTKLGPLREALNTELQQSWQEWEIPHEADAKWSAKAKQLHADWWQARIARQKEIDASIAAGAHER